MDLSPEVVRVHFPGKAAHKSSRELVHMNCRGVAVYMKLSEGRWACLSLCRRSTFLRPRAHHTPCRRRCDQILLAKKKAAFLVQLASPLLV